MFQAGFEKVAIISAFRAMGQKLFGGGSQVTNTLTRNAKSLGTNTTTSLSSYTKNPSAFNRHPLATSSNNLAVLQAKRGRKYVDL